jgi:cysteine-rich repeat protein
MGRLLLFLLCSLLPIRAQAQTTAASACGNQVIEGREQCDDGNVSNDDGCSYACMIEPPKDPLVGVAISVAGMLFAPVVGGSIGYLYTGDREKFRRTAGLQGLAAAAKVAGVVVLFVDFSQDAFALANDEASDVGFSPLGLTLIGVGSVASLVLDISAIIGTADSVNQHNQRASQYQKDKPESSTSRRLRGLEGLTLAPTPQRTPAGSLVPGASLRLRW